MNGSVRYYHITSVVLICSHLSLLVMTNIVEQQPISLNLQFCWDKLQKSPLTHKKKMTKVFHRFGVCPTDIFLDFFPVVVAVVGAVVLVIIGLLILGIWHWRNKKEEEEDMELNYITPE